MRLRWTIALVLAAAAGKAELFDRVAVSVGARAIKASEIDRDIRITAFLNGAQLDLGAAEKKKAASRLVDQALIRAEMAKGKYAAASPAEVDEVVGRLKKVRFANDGQYSAALSAYGIAEAELKAHVAWQIAVLRFIELRFQPAPGAAKAGAAAERKALEEKVNRVFFTWLDESRRRAAVQYREDVAP